MELTEYSHSLIGKVAIVTGSTKGIGRWVAESYARHGIKVVITARNADECGKVADFINQSGGIATAYACDMSNVEQIKRLVHYTIHHFGGLDILVNNAGIASNRKFILDIDENEYDKVMDTNLKGTYFAASEAARYMKEHGGGTVINVSSTNAKLIRHNVPNSVYATSKAGIVMLTKSMAEEWAEHGIRVNCVAPGRFATDRVLTRSQEEHRRVVDTIPMRRMGNAEDLVGAFLFFATDASRYVTGQTLYVDGGRTVL